MRTLKSLHIDGQYQWVHQHRNVLRTGLKYIEQLNLLYPAAKMDTLLFRQLRKTFDKLRFSIDQ